MNDANDLDLTTGNDARGVGAAVKGLASWRTVLLKQRTGGLVYSLYASNDSSLARERHQCLRRRGDLGSGGAPR